MKKKIIKTEFITLSLAFAMLLTACSGNNIDNEQPNTSTEEKNQIDTVSENISAESQSSTSELSADTTIVTNLEETVSENTNEENQINTPELSADTTSDPNSEQTVTEEKIQLNVSYPEPASAGAEKGGALPFEYKGIEYVWASPCAIGEYIIDKDKNVFDLITGASELDLEYPVNSAMKELKSLDYIGKVGETNLGALVFDEADMYMYADNLLLVYNAVRYDIMFFQNYYGIEFTLKEKEEWAEGTVNIDDALAEHGIEYDPSIFFNAVLYAPEA